MTPEAQRVAIAEMDGWSDCHTGPGWQFDVTGTPPNWGDSGMRYHQVPDYLHSRDAIVPVIEKRGGDARKFTDTLFEVMNYESCCAPHNLMAMLYATPAQLCKATLIDAGKWDDSA